MLTEMVCLRWVQRMSGGGSDDAVVPYGPPLHKGG
jgi:hypothetical protein